jgi:hypothetical protein
MPRSILLASGALALPFLSACTESGGPPAGQGLPTTTNLGLAVAPGELVGAGELWLFAAREFDTGGRDLNGDGDAFDRIVHVQDLARRRVRSTGLALDPRGTVPLLAASGELALFGASEPAGGGRDLNGDGDANDVVGFALDGPSATTRSLALALESERALAIEGRLAAFLVSEAAEGRDLDGDGLRRASVLHLYDGAADALTNTRLALGSAPFVGGGRVAYFAAETSTDLNGDGDLLDGAVLQVLDPTTGTSANTGLATFGETPLHAADAWLVGVPEVAQALDLNADGDLDDVVLQVFDAASGAVRNLGLVGAGSGAVFASRRPAGGERFGILASEFGDRDRNADGDTGDLVAFLYDPGVDRLTSLARASVSATFAGAWLACLALESGEGAGLDLNADGDVLDAVALLLNPATGAVTNLQQDALALVGSDEVLALARPEAGSKVDWNGDGDQDDVVVHVHDPLAGTSTNTALASAGVLGATRAAVLLAVDEGAESRDLTGDGDRLDVAFVRFDLAARRGANLGLAGSPAGPVASLSPAGRVLVLVSEAAQGRDLTGDGDRADEVVHRSE